MPVADLLNICANLLPQARAVREQVWGKQVFTRGIVEFSNHCQQNCLYCGLRRDNTALTRYRLSQQQIMQAAHSIKKLGMGTVVLQSGEDPAYDQQCIAQLIRRIKDELGLAVTLSLGERPAADIKAWKQAGADRYLLKMETFTQPLYSRLRPGCQLEQRLNCLQDICQAGYESGSGLITGLPWQTRAQMQEDLETLAAMKLDMVSLSPFSPHPQTPLARYLPDQATNNLQALAFIRCHNPTSHIPVSSALALYGQEVKLEALTNVCDVIMLSLTPADVRSAYNIYPGKNLSPLRPYVRAREILNDLRKHGFELPNSPGSAWRHYACGERGDG